MEIYMNNYKVVKIAIIIYAFTKSFMLGVMALAYLILMEQKNKNLEAQIMAGVKEDEILSDGFEEPLATAEKIVLYKECVIEKHSKKYYIIKPSGKYLKKVFDEVEDATSEIDAVASFFPPKGDTSQKTHNIRFVR